MYKFILKLLLIINLNASDEQESYIHIWTQKEKPSVENNFQYNKRIYQTNNIGEAIGVTLIESLFYIDKIKIEEDKLNTDFEYLNEFENSIKER